MSYASRLKTLIIWHKLHLCQFMLKCSLSGAEVMSLPCYRCSLIQFYPLFLEDVLYHCSIGFFCFSSILWMLAKANWLLKWSSYSLLLPVLYLFFFLISLVQCKCFSYIMLPTATVSIKVSVNNFCEPSHCLLKYSFQLKGVWIEPRVRGQRLCQPAGFVYFYMPVQVCHTWAFQQAFNKNQ